MKKSPLTWPSITAIIISGLIFQACNLPVMLRLNNPNNDKAGGTQTTPIPTPVPTSLPISLFAVDYGNQIHVSHDSGATWTASGSISNWSVVFCSADGSFLATGIGGTGTAGNIYTSTNGGASSALAGATALKWLSVAGNATGSTLVAATYGSLMLQQSFDSGATWNPISIPGTGWWSEITTSSDCSVMFAIKGYLGSNHLISRYASSSWSSPSDFSLPWHNIATSGSGQYVLALANNQKPVCSSGSGAPGTWIQSTDPTVPTPIWTCAAVSRDGSAMLAGEYGAGAGGYLWKSSDHGVTWVQLMADTPRRWSSTKISADGSKIIACVDNGSPGENYIWFSPDGGTTWTKQTGANAGLGNWVGVALQD